MNGRCMNSSKFSKKLRFVHNLSELSDLLPMEVSLIPPPTLHLDACLTGCFKKQQQQQQVSSADQCKKATQK